MNRDARNRQLRQIKAAGRSIFRGDEAAERDCYESLTGKRSCRLMTDAELRQVGDYLARASGHKPDKPVTFAPSSSRDLALVLADYQRRDPPPGWRLNPLRTRKVWRQTLGLESSVPFEHLTSAQQDRLHRFCRKAWHEPGDRPDRIPVASCRSSQ